MTYQPGPGFPGEIPDPGSVQQDQQQLPAYPGYGGAPGAPGAGAPFSPPPGPPPMPNTDKMNTMAVISLILGIIGCLSLVGLILGFVSLGQIKRTGERGRGLAIAGIVLFPVWIVIGVVANFAVPDSATTPQAGVSPKATQTKPQTIDVTKMRVGQCINDSATGEIESVKMVPCTTPHDGEVLYTGKLHGLILPTEAQIKQQARTLCDGTASSRLERDPAASVLAMTEYYPTAESWRSGDHGVACVAVHGTEGKKLTRPLKTG